MNIYETASRFSLLTGSFPTADSDLDLFTVERNLPAVVELTVENDMSCKHDEPV